MDVDSGIVSMIVFFLLRLCERIQSIFAFLFWLIFIKPGLFLAKCIDVNRRKSIESEKKTEHFTTLDTLIWYHKTLLFYLKVVFRINSLISGVVSGKNTYSKLLTWNRKLPVIGFRADKTTFIIELLLKKVKNGRSVDMIFLTGHRVNGVFKTISRELDNHDKEEIIIKCLWIMGKNQGMTFNLDRYFPYNFGSRNSETEPSAIYHPPQIVIFLFEMLISTSAIIAFLQLTKDGWKIIRDFLIEIISSIK